MTFPFDTHDVFRLQVLPESTDYGRRGRKHLYLRCDRREGKWGKVEINGGKWKVKEKKERLQNYENTTDERIN